MTTLTQNLRTRHDAPPELKDFKPDSEVVLDRGLFAVNARSFSKGVAPDPLGTRNEYLAVLLDDERTTELWCNAAQQLATGDVPEKVGLSLAVGRTVG